MSGERSRLMFAEGRVRERRKAAVGVRKGRVRDLETSAGNSRSQPGSITESVAGMRRI